MVAKTNLQAQQASSKSSTMLSLLLQHPSSGFKTTSPAATGGQTVRPAANR
jgi:hypothetical protein